MISPDIRVAFIGASGTAGSLLLEQINTAVGICVGLATLVYVVTKLVYLIKNKGKHSE